MVEYGQRRGEYENCLYANTQKSLSFHIVKPNEEQPNGVVFGLMDDTCLSKVETSIFPDIIQDWSKIEIRIKAVC
jgi:hypothetical protein